MPQDLTDPFDPRSMKNAPRRGAVFGLNDLNIEEEDGFKAAAEAADDDDVDATAGAVDATADDVDATAGDEETAAPLEEEPAASIDPY